MSIVKLDLKGPLPETVKKVEYEKKQESFPGKSVSGGETQSEIDANMKQIIADLPDLFTDTTGKVHGPPIKII